MSWGYRPVKYDEGTLAIFEFMRFSLKPLSENNPALLHELRKRFLVEKNKREMHRHPRAAH